MYFPILRGRQFELLALQECLKSGILSSKVIPLVEPVKVSATFRNTISEFIKAEHPIAIIRNPQVGSWLKESCLVSISIPSYSHIIVISSYFYDDTKPAVYIDIGPEAPGPLQT